MSVPGQLFEQPMNTQVEASNMTLNGLMLEMVTMNRAMSNRLQFLEGQAMAPRPPPPAPTSRSTLGSSVKHTLPDPFKCHEHCSCEETARRRRGDQRISTTCRLNDGGIPSRLEERGLCPPIAGLYVRWVLCPSPPTTLLLLSDPHVGTDLVPRRVRQMCRACGQWCSGTAGV